MKSHHLNATTKISFDWNPSSINSIVRYAPSAALDRIRSNEDWVFKLSAGNLSC